MDDRLMDTSPLSFVPYADAVETHISAVLFAGDRAYKQLKPIETPFLDYRTREARAIAAHRETELNARLAPDVYLGVVDVTEDDEVVDHLIVMRRMPEARRLATLLAGPEGGDALRSVARAVAAFHASELPSEFAARVASREAEHQRWRDNLEEMRALGAGTGLDPAVLDRIEVLSDRYLDRREALFAQRREAGLARDGHGDLLAEDIFVLDDGPRILDCLAFSDELRQGDVLADIAFLVMDVERLAGERAGARLLQWYQEFSNERHPASLAHFYVGYRALVRAKVGALRATQTRDRDDVQGARNHLAQSLAHLERAQLRVVLVGGGPGTGKTTMAETVADALRCPVLLSDEIRKDLAGIGHTVSAEARPDEGIYEPSMTDRTYATLVDEAALLLRHGETVVLDASWASAAHRAAARAMAAAEGADVIELECRLDPAIAKERIVRRSSSPWTVSDATPAIVDHMAAVADAWPEAVPIDTQEPPGHCRAAALRAVLGF
jgi:aminoglycoside phosphotransferase family enzyme/predicted kinase